MKKIFDDDTYSSLKEIVGGIFLSAIEGKGFGVYQAFGYAYDEVEIMFLDGEFQNICLLVALFFYAGKYGVEPLRDDLSFSMMLDELRLKIYKVESEIGAGLIDPRLMEKEFLGDVEVVRNIYLQGC
ncbi:hypothetical protein ACI2S3_12960 [Ralstonia nicotianae]|uniref:hypothetical protein n=1 Tax=Ralstonia solanacearum species complex TaxID=3116862 RepID=UPI00036A97EF|nr:hypothetical protein [Ralstonia pseudosolanacearum]MCK4125865.1 hypothetical protein [Ralstonia pseudosolanacearum]MDO3549608.1 hypothetical protein [Ralstonia pseudosolanacearum]QIK21258.1 hypothetical protein G7968_23030 [Ralstonia solanacearum]